MCRLELKDLDVKAIDPGKINLLECVSHDDPTGPRVRYTAAERRRDLRTRQYEDEARRSKPEEVRAAEESLSHFNSRTTRLEAYKAYCVERCRVHSVALVHYSDLAHRHRARKRRIKLMKSEQKVCDKIAAMHDPSDPRTPVIAYGAWGAVAGVAGQVTNRGNPPCIGKGLLNVLVKKGKLKVVLTPEHYTSSLCLRCLSPCGPWTELEEKMGRKIRGIRVCQNEACRLPQNRDRTGATNIATQFCRLYEGKSPIRQMTDEEKEFNRLRVCVECD